MGLSSAFVALDLAGEKALDRLSWRERRQARAAFRRNRRDILADAFSDFSAGLAEAPEVGVGEDDGDDRPLLDFWQWLIENTKIQEFMTFLVEVFLPRLFELIVAFITALAVL